MTNLPVPSDPSRCYDNTRVSAWKTCPRSYFLRHMMHWRKIGNAAALIFGSSWHNAQDIIWRFAKKMPKDDLAACAFLAFEKNWVEEGMPQQPGLEEIKRLEPRTPGIAAEMLYSYVDKRWRMLQTANVLAIEAPFAVPMPYLDGVWYIGRLDKVVEYQAQRLVLEHKSTTAYAIQGDFRQDYLDSWYMSAQVSGYQFGGTLYFGDIHNVWIDAALVHKKIHDAFRFVPVSHSATILEEWLKGTAQWISEIIQEEKTFEALGELTPQMFKKNHESCYGKYGPCPYIDICRTVADPSKLTEPPPGFVVEKWEPFEELGIDKLLQGANNG